MYLIFPHNNMTKQISHDFDNYFLCKDFNKANTLMKKLNREQLKKEGETDFENLSYHYIITSIADPLN